MTTTEVSRPARFLSLAVTPFVRVTLIVTSVGCIIGSCRVINAHVQERSAWRRYETLEKELGLRRGMEKAVLVSALNARGLEYQLLGDPDRPKDEYPPQMVWAIVAKWTGPVFPEELGIQADLDATGKVIAWRPMPQGGP